MINENNYRNLSEAETNMISQFNNDLINQTNINNDNLKLYEINSLDIKSITSTNKYTWIHLWRPFCQTDYCQNINYYPEIAEKFKSNGLVFLLISETYDINDIRNCLKVSEYNRPVFVLQDSYYGHKIRKNRLMFLKDFDSLAIKHTKIGFDDYIFRDTVLLYAGDGINSYKIDSLIRLNF